MSHSRFLISSWMCLEHKMVSLGFSTREKCNLLGWGKTCCHLLTNERWNWVSEDSFRETVESYTDFGLITKLISAHLRSCSRSSNYSYHTFALVRGCSITPCKQNHPDWPTPLVRQICALLPLSWCPCWYKWGDERMIVQGTYHTRLQSLYRCESVSGQGVRCLHSRTAAWLQRSVSYPCIQNLLRLENCKEKCWKT